jgi:2-methylisocitrate lyase-like PEP mutase family enzyme
MPSQAERAERFLALHARGRPFLMPNPWDVGSARLLESLGFEALATTSGGFAASLGRLDGSVTRDEALAHAAAVALAVDVPVSADLENCFADDPDGVAATVRMAVAAGLAGCSVEDARRGTEDPIYEQGLAVERVAAAVEAAHGGPVHLVLSARSENFVRGRPDLDDTIARLRAFREAGADVLFPTGVRKLEDVRRVVGEVGGPINVLVGPGSPSVAELAGVGVSRISVGSAFAWTGLGAVVEAAQELLGPGTYGFWDRAAIGRARATEAFGPR